MRLHEKKGQKAHYDKIKFAKYLADQNAGKKPVPKPIVKPVAAVKPVKEKVKKKAPNKVISHIISTTHKPQEKKPNNRHNNEKRASKTLEEAKARKGQKLCDVIKDCLAKGLVMQRIEKGIKFVKPGKNIKL